MPNRSVKIIVALFLFLTILLNMHALSLAADITPPVTTKSLDPASPDGNNNWYVTPVEITFSATDLGSGVNSINYKVDSNDWIKVNFSNTLNLAPNPSFEDYSDASSIYTRDWEKTVSDGQTSYNRDSTIFAPGFNSTSIKINTTGTGWHGVNNAGSYAAASPLTNMSASAWIQTNNVTESAYFKIYSVSMDSNSLPVYTYLAQSTAVSGSSPGSVLFLNFVNTDANSIGIYMDIGLDGPGTIWADAVNISNSSQIQTTTFVVGSDSENHTIEYFSDDRSGNVEAHDCDSDINCFSFKLDASPPDNWNNSGAFRGVAGSDHELYVYTDVEDATSGLSTLTDKFWYHTDFKPGFGRYSNLLGCNSTWQPDVSVTLISPSFLPGSHGAYLLTPKTDFCNNDWKTCKTVRFYAEDMAGNYTTQDFCINGPWVKFRGSGIVRSNQNISMVSAPEEENTDGLVEIQGTTINYFTSTRDWKIKSAQRPLDYDYEGFKKIVRSNPVTRTSLTTTSGVYQITGNFEINNSTLPNDFDSRDFTQIYFIGGNLRISTDIDLETNSTALFIVKGDVQIGKRVNTVKAGIFSDGDFYSAYDIQEAEGSGTLTLEGVYSANKFYFQRTLQGTNNTKYPSESFIYSPKYTLNLRDYLGTNSIIWKTTQ